MKEHSSGFKLMNDPLSFRSVKEFDRVEFPSKWMENMVVNDISAIKQVLFDGKNRQIISGAYETECHKIRQLMQSSPILFKDIVFYTNDHGQQFYIHISYNKKDNFFQITTYVYMKTLPSDTNRFCELYRYGDFFNSESLRNFVWPEQSYLTYMDCYWNMFYPFLIKRFKDSKDLFAKKSLLIAHKSLNSFIGNEVLQKDVLKAREYLINRCIIENVHEYYTFSMLLAIYQTKCFMTQVYQKIAAMLQERNHCIQNSSNSVISKDITPKNSTEKNINNQDHFSPKIIVLSNDVKIHIKSRDNIHTGYVRRTESWDVCGHYRHYKNGKTIFIQPYSKGSGSQKQQRIYKVKESSK